MKKFFQVGIPGRNSWTLFRLLVCADSFKTAWFVAHLTKNCDTPEKVKNRLDQLTKQDPQLFSLFQDAEDLKGLTDHLFGCNICTSRVQEALLCDSGSLPDTMIFKFNEEVEKGSAMQ